MKNQLVVLSLLFLFFFMKPGGYTIRHLILKVKSSGRYYIAVMHRVGDRTEWHYIKPEDIDKVFNEDLQKLIKQSLEKCLEGVRKIELRRVASAEARRRIITLLVRKCRSVQDIDNYLRILEGLAEVEKFARLCTEVLQRGSAEDKTVIELRRKCIDLDCGLLGWSYNALSVFC